ncbi:MAG: hypothetical protein ABIO76_07560, partial [Ginsengibacter sp.]
WTDNFGNDVGMGRSEPQRGGIFLAHKLQRGLILTLIKCRPERAGLLFDLTALPKFRPDGLGLWLMMILLSKCRREGATIKTNFYLGLMKLYQAPQDINWLVTTCTSP